MKYNNLIKSSENFQSSVNLQFDLNKLEKIDKYIPTIQSVLILRRYLNAIYNKHNKKDHATVLIGPYGRGKSHLLLILSAIINCNDINNIHIKSLIKKIAKVDSETAELATKIIEEKRLLPVIISCNHININQSFLLALKEALERNGLNDLFPETYFEAALNAIDLWEESYESAFKLLKKLIKDKKTTIHNLKIALKQYNREAYNMFCELYPQISNGAEFNPLKNSDIVQLYTQVSNELCEKYNYCGVYIIFDEFSKFLESDVATSDMQNMKIIQDFAELSKSSSTFEMHLCCVTHKGILDYSQSDSFRTVEGRFTNVYFVASSEQSYELVANALEQTNEFGNYYMNHEIELLSIFNDSHNIGIFNEIPEEKFIELMIRCFPLHPVTTYSLIKISELVGQNERTLFTFLSDTSSNTLSEFLNMDIEEGKMEVLTLDVVYDYFSELFKYEVFSQRIHSIWIKTNIALKQTNDDIIQKKIIKTVALMNIINQDDFIPVSASIKKSLNLRDEEYNIAIETLKRNNVLTLRHDMQYAFLTPSGVNIRQSITDYIERGLVKLDRPAILKETYSTPYILPRQYNGDKCMMRYFCTSFMEVEDFLNYNGNFNELKNGADGLVIYLITDQDNDDIDSVEKLTSLKPPKNVLFCISEPWKNNEILNEYIAACALEHSKEAQDVHFKEELLFYKEDLYKTIQNIVNRIYSPSNLAAVYYNSGVGYDSIINNTMLNRELSNICNNYYTQTPIINNEMINKNNLTAPIKKARIKLIDWLLCHSEDIPLMEGAGPEVSIQRATIMVPGLSESSNSPDKNLNEVLNYISSLIEDGESRRIEVSEIYTCLMSAPYGIRKGIIPIYIAYIFRKNLDKIIFYFKDKEIELSGEQFNYCDKNPENYSFKVEKGTKEKDEYLKFILESLDPDNVNTINKRSYAVKAMQTWFRGLPKFARDHDYNYGDEVTAVENNIRKLRKNIILYDINSYYFLYDFIPEIFETESFTEVKNHISSFFEDSNNFISDFKIWLSGKVFDIFKKKLKGSLFSVMKAWYDDLSEITKKNIFDTDTNIILKFINTNNDYDDEYVISSLAKSITTFAIEDWNDNQVNEFLSIIERCVESVSKYNESEHLCEDQNVSITFTLDGNIYEKQLDNSEISPIAETALNNIESVFEDYMDAISPQDKVSILLRLLRTEIENI